MKPDSSNTERMLIEEGGQTQPSGMTFQPTGQSMQATLGEQVAMNNAMQELGQRTRS